MVQNTPALLFESCQSIPDACHRYLNPANRYQDSAKQTFFGETWSIDAI
ncbi:hypothetical protein [Arsenicibacter rosenii]|nr:hypothetical protein [Arsenicibacter rosenii]